MSDRTVIEENPTSGEKFSIAIVDECFSVIRLKPDGTLQHGTEKRCSSLIDAHSYIQENGYKA